jgi:phage gp36-like protein
MPYLTSADLRTRFGAQEIDELSDPLRTGTPDESVLTRAINDAGALADGYLAARYTLPLTYTPEMVASWCADIARYRLWDDQAPEEVRRRYEDAMSQLKLVSTGVIALPPDVNGDVPVNTSGMDYYSDARVFTADTLDDF